MAKDLKIVCVLLNTLEEELDDPYYLSIHHAIHLAASRRQVFMEEVSYSGVSEIKRISQNADGVIVIGSGGSCDVDLMSKVLAEHPVSICVDFDPGIPRPDRVRADFSAPISELINHFVQTGHRRIGYIGGKEQGSPGSPAVIQDAREALFKSALVERGLLDEALFLSEGGYNHENGYRLMQRILQVRERPTAVHVATDNMAVGAYKAVADAGLKVPQDIALVGCNDQVGAAYMNPPLSSIRVMTALMGTAALGLALDRIAEPRETGLTLSVPTTLVLRESSLPAPAASVRRE